MGLVGLGLLYQGTGHRHMAEVCLTELGRPPGPEMENCTDRESYSLAAGKKGQKAKYYHTFCQTKQSKIMCSNTEGHFLWNVEGFTTNDHGFIGEMYQYQFMSYWKISLFFIGLALGMITLGQGESLQNASLNDLNLPESLYYHMVGGPRPDSLNKFKFRSPSYQVQEGDTINIDVTSPGATLALGLMFFR